MIRRQARSSGHHAHSASEDDHFSPLQIERGYWEPVLPNILTCIVESVQDNVTKVELDDKETLEKLFPCTFGQKLVNLQISSKTDKLKEHKPLRIGVVLSGGQAAGGHNVISGIFDFVKKCHTSSQLFGFLNGPHGVFSHIYKEIDSNMMNRYRNQGGFDMICSGRHKIETEEQKKASMEICKKLDLHGLVVVGGDDSNTNAAVLAEYFKANKCETCVIGCPKTIDGDLKNEFVEASFGFDTATKVYSELIGNLCTDVATSQNRYHFIRLMGRAASNITLECALQTRPNLVFIGEEVKAQNKSLMSLVEEIANMVIQRYKEYKRKYGIVILPEGLIEFVSEMGSLLSEINDVLAQGEFDETKLSEKSKNLFSRLPDQFKEELLLDRDPHGNVQVAKIETEKLMVQMTQKMLEEKGYGDLLIPTTHYFGYEGRCAMPSNFDANYCYGLGHCAGALVDLKFSGYMATLRDLHKPPKEWQPAGCPLVNMMNIEHRKGKDVPVIKKYLVDLESPLYQQFKKVRDQWKIRDCYRNPGPIQFQGACADVVNYSILPPKNEDLLPQVPFNYSKLLEKYHFVKSTAYMSPLQLERLADKTEVASILKDPMAQISGGQKSPHIDQQTYQFVSRAFPLQCSNHKLMVHNVGRLQEKSPPPGLSVGVVLCGQQSPGAMNVVVGMFERLSILRNSKLLGFKGVTGLLQDDCIEMTREDLKLCTNQGGFEVLGRTAETKPMIRTPEGMLKVLNICNNRSLDGLVMIGGQTTLTDAALLTEHLLSHQSKTCVIGVPATQENNLRNPFLETCIGFDSTSKCFASLVGNLLTDAASATKYWYFVRLMGLSPSHIVLESALQTHPNMCLVSEEYASNDATLDDVVQDIADTICARAEVGKNFGTVLVPEGLVTKLPQTRQLLTEIDRLLKVVKSEDFVKLQTELVDLPTNDGTYAKQLSPWSLAVLKSLPPFFRKQLLRKTPSGRIELSEVGVEQLLSEMVKEELHKRAADGSYKGSFSPVAHYLGFQGRSTLPSKFDCSLGMSHGYLSVILIESRLTGYVTSVRGLCSEAANWKMSAVPIACLMKVMPEKEMKLYGRQVPMVPCADVELNGRPYKALKNAIAQWDMNDCFCNPGPIQFTGTGSYGYNRMLHEEHYEYLKMLNELNSLTTYVQGVCTFGVNESTLKTAVLSLDALKQIVQYYQKEYIYPDNK